MSDQNELEVVTFSILGDSFTLKCTAEQKAILLESVDHVKNATANILRDNPNLNPKQAAILVAIEVQGKFSNYTNYSSPFFNSAKRSMQKIKKTLSYALDRNTYE